MSEMALRQLGRVDETLSTPVDAAGLPEIDYNTMNKDYEQYRGEALQKLQDYYTPQLDSQWLKLENTLANQGVTMGSEAWREAQQAHTRARTDAELQMYRDAGQESDRAFAMDQSRQQQQSINRERALQERMALRNQPINEITALTSGLQVNSPQFAQYQPGTIRPTDVAGQYNHYDQMQMQLHVTNLKFCDYVEAQFSSKYNNTPERVGPGLYNGFIALIRYAEMKGDNEFYYVYSPVNTDVEWQPEIKENEELVEIISWRLINWHEKLITRSEEWWTSIRQIIDEFWEDVEKAKRGEFVVPESTRPTKKTKEDK
jgi:hypothetical protein